jgi:hypothetical protein
MGVYGIKDSANIIMKTKADDKVFLRSPYATVSNCEYSADTIYAMDKTSRAVRWDSNRQAQVKFSFEIFELKWLSILAGSSFVTGATSIMKAEYLTTAGATPTITLAATPVSGSLAVFTVNTDGITHKAEMTSGTPGSNVATFSLSGAVVTLNATTCPAGTAMVAYYLETTAATAQTLTISADAFPANYEIYMDTYIRDKDTGVDSFVQWHYTNVKPMSNFTITNSAADKTTLEVNFDVFKDLNGNMATFTIV